MKGLVILAAVGISLVLLGLLVALVSIGTNRPGLESAWAILTGGMIGGVAAMLGFVWKSVAAVVRGKEPF